MKKRMCLCMMVVFLVILTCGCGKDEDTSKDDPITGKWNYVGIEYENEPDDYETIMFCRNLDNCLVVNENNRFVLTLNVKKHIGIIEKEKDGSYTCIFDDEDDRNETIGEISVIQDDMLSLVLTEDLTLILAKEGSEAEEKALEELENSEAKDE